MPNIQTKTKRIMSGMRPTGRLHIGHYFGALTNWLKFQDKYDAFYSIVDWHALTTKYQDTKEISKNTIEVALDWFAVGLDPEQSTIYVQSLFKKPPNCIFYYLCILHKIGWSVTLL